MVSVDLDLLAAFDPLNVPLPDSPASSPRTSAIFLDKENARPGLAATVSSPRPSPKRSAASKLVDIETPRPAAGRLFGGTPSQKAALHVGALAELGSNGGQEEQGWERGGYTKDWLCDTPRPAHTQTAYMDPIVVDHASVGGQHSRGAVKPFADHPCPRSPSSASNSSYGTAHSRFGSIDSMGWWLDDEQRHPASPQRQALGEQTRRPLGLYERDGGMSPTRVKRPATEQAIIGTPPPLTNGQEAFADRRQNVPLSPGKTPRHQSAALKRAMGLLERDAAADASPSRSRADSMNNRLRERSTSPTKGKDVLRGQSAPTFDVSELQSALEDGCEQPEASPAPGRLGEKDTALASSLRDIIAKGNVEAQSSADDTIDFSLLPALPPSPTRLSDVLGGFDDASFDLREDRSFARNLDDVTISDISVDLSALQRTENGRSQQPWRPQRSPKRVIGGHNPRSPADPSSSKQVTDQSMLRVPVGNVRTASDQDVGLADRSLSTASTVSADLSTELGLRSSTIVRYGNVLNASLPPSTLAASIAPSSNSSIMGTLASPRSAALETPFEGDEENNDVAPTPLATRPPSPTRDRTENMDPSPSSDGDTTGSQFTLASLGAGATWTGNNLERWLAHHDGDTEALLRRAERASPGEESPSRQESGRATDAARTDSNSEAPFKPKDEGGRGAVEGDSSRNPPPASPRRKSAIGRGKQSDRVERPYEGASLSVMFHSAPTARTFAFPSTKDKEAAPSKSVPECSAAASGERREPVTSADAATIDDDGANSGSVSSFRRLGQSVGSRMPVPTGGSRHAAPKVSGATSGLVSIRSQAAPAMQLRDHKPSTSTSLSLAPPPEHSTSSALRTRGESSSAAAYSNDSTSSERPRLPFKDGQDPSGTRTRLQSDPGSPTRSKASARVGAGADPVPPLAVPAVPRSLRERTGSGESWEGGNDVGEGKSKRPAFVSRLAAPPSSRLRAPRPASMVPPAVSSGPATTRSRVSAIGRPLSLTSSALPSSAFFIGGGGGATASTSHASQPSVPGIGFSSRLESSIQRETTIPGSRLAYRPSTHRTSKTLSGVTDRSETSGSAASASASASTTKTGGSGSRLPKSASSESGMSGGGAGGVEGGRFGFVRGNGGMGLGGRRGREVGR